MKTTITTAMLALFVSATLAVTNVAYPATAREEKAPDGHRLLILENDVLKVVVDLDVGARVTEYVYAPFEENLVYEVGSYGGMLMDHVWEQTWPGEFLGRKYDGEIVKAGPHEAAVRVWTMGEGDTIEGIRMERTIALRGDARLLHCRVALQNAGDEGRVTGYWNQNNFYFRGTREGIKWFVPQTRGVGNPGWWVEDPTAGWIGTWSSKVPGGVMFLMDYNDLWKPYPNSYSVTTEWFYDRVAIPAGKTWTTDIYIIPSKGNHGYRRGSEVIVANFLVEEEPGGLKVVHELTQSLQPLRDVTLATRAWGLKEEWEVQTETEVDRIDESMTVVPVKLTGTGAMPAGIEVALTGKTPDGKTLTDKWADYYGGIAGVNNDPFTMEPYLKFERPPKEKVFLKPDVLEYRPNETPKVLFLRGIWHEFFRVDEALKAAFAECEVETGWLRSSPVGLSFSQWPADYPGILSYDLIVLGNVPADPFDLVGQEMLADYLKAGGNVLILGGDRSYGNAGFTNEGLIGLLPVELGGMYNYRRIKGGGVLEAVGEHPVLKGVHFGPKDMVYFSHVCEPKAGASVVVTAADRPILLLAATPKGGRVACVLATPFGEAPKGETAFWDADGWNRLMQNTVKWLVGRSNNR